MSAGPAKRRPRRRVDGILLLDKPAGLTSNAALQAVKRIYQAEKAGHTGSLDPIATGLLPVCFGQATKLSGILLEGDKRYRVRAQLGVKTTTGDREGDAVASSDASTLTRAQLEAALPRLTGTLVQMPPMYSALKFQGKRLYELAREGFEVERAPRQVRIHELKLLSFGEGYFEVDVTCSKGTYVRSLVEDLAAAVGQVAHVQELRRLGAAPFWSPQMVSLQAVEQVAMEGVEALDRLLLPPARGVAALPQVRIDETRAFYLSRGQAVRVNALPDSQSIAVLNPAGELVGIGRRDADGMLAPSRWLT